MSMNPYQQYKNNEVMTVNPAKLTLMLYDGAIKFINLGIEGVENKDIEKKSNYLLRAQEIITELQSTLDGRVPIAKEFDRLYTYIKELLVQGNIKCDIEKLEEARYLVREFRDMWNQVMKQNKC